MLENLWVQILIALLLREIALDIYQRIRVTLLINRLRKASRKVSKKKVKKKK